MDPVVASWIKEFVLRQNIAQNIAEGVLAMLPSEPADSESESSLRVRRGIFQRRLAEGLTRRVVNPHTLRTIEALYALRPLPAAVDAYRVVAVHLAAAAMAADFPTVVSDLWSRHIPSLLRSPSVAGLVSPRLESQVRELELGVVDDNLRVRIMSRYSKSRALDAIRDLLEAEYKDVGPPILELVAETVSMRGQNVPSGSQAEAEAEAQVARQQAPQTPPVAAQHHQVTQTPPGVAQHDQATQAPSGAKSTEMPPQTEGQPNIDGSRLGKGIALTINEGGRNSKKAMEPDPTAHNSRLGKCTTPTSNKVIERDPAACNSRLGKGTDPTTNEGGGNSKKAMEQDPAARNSQLGNGTTLTSNKIIERNPAACNSRLGKGTDPTTNEEEGYSKKAMEQDPAARNSQLSKGTTPTSNKVIERDPAACNSRLGKGTDPTTNEEGGNSKKAMERDPAAHNNRLGKGTDPTTNEEEGNSKKAMEQDPAARNSPLDKGITPTSNKVIERDRAACNNPLGKGTDPTTNEDGGNSKSAMEPDPAARNNRLGKGTTQTMNEKEGNSNKAMDQDPTVRPYEQDGNLKRKAVCPPTSVVNKRRKTRRWSVLEEDTLRSAVRELGKGYWKEILRNHSDVFEGRTEVDLKDKWRNMTR